MGKLTIIIAAVFMLAGCGKANRDRVIHRAEVASVTLEIRRFVTPDEWRVTFTDGSSFISPRNQWIRGDSVAVVESSGGWRYLESIERTK